MPECTLRANLSRCTCTYLSCERRGKCCECVAYHRAHGEIPGCFFPSDVERTYDRSIRCLVEAYRGR